MRVEIKVCLLVGVRRLELPTSTSRTWRAANCATPRKAPSFLERTKLSIFFEYSAKKAVNSVHHRINFHKTTYIKSPHLQKYTKNQPAHRCRKFHRAYGTRIRIVVLTFFCNFADEIRACRQLTPDVCRSLAQTL